MAGRRQAWMIVLAGMAALGLSMGVGRFAYTALLPAMQREGLGTALAGVIAGLNLFGYMVGALACGKLSERLREPVFAVAVVVSVLTTMGMAVTTNEWWWLALRAIAGPCSAFVMVLGAGLVMDRLVGLGRADLSGLAFAGIGLGVACSGLVAATGGREMSALTGWLILGGVAAVLALPALRGLLGPVHHVSGAAAPTGRGGPSLLALTAAYSCQGLGYSISATFLVAVVARGASPELAGWAWMAAGLAAVPSALVWRAMAKRHGAAAALATAQLVQGVGMVLPVLSDGAVPAFLSAITFGGTFVAIVALALAEARRLGGVPAIGRVTALYGIGQAIAPVVAGWVAQTTGTFSHSLLAGAAIVSLGAAILAPSWIRGRQACLT